MTKMGVMQEFYSTFGLDAYPANSVPAKAEYPYLTYEPYISNMYGQETVYPAVNLYYRTDSEAIINAKADEIIKKIGSGVSLPCDDGLIVVRFTSAWQPVTDAIDSTLKRRYTTLAVDFHTL